MTWETLYKFLHIIRTHRVAMVPGWFYIYKQNSNDLYMRVMYVKFSGEEFIQFYDKDVTELSCAINIATADGKHILDALNDRAYACAKSVTNEKLNNPKIR